MSAESQIKIAQVCDDIKALLLEKNAKYGDSALNPLRVMSQASPVEQILVRIDDKLSRIKHGNILEDDEDVVSDLIGYFVCLKLHSLHPIITKHQPLYNVSICRNSLNSKEPEHYQPVHPHQTRQRVELNVSDEEHPGEGNHPGRLRESGCHL